jgi:hypothetical protein
MSKRIVCLSNSTQLGKSAMLFAGDNNRRYPRRSGSSSGYSGGFMNNDDAVPEWGEQFEGYISGMDIDGDPSPVMYCPSISSNRGATWRPAYKPD